MKFIKEFKEFAVRGNALDLAVGVIIGAGFSAITTSLVDDILMPPLSLLVGNVDFTEWELVLKPATDGNEAVTLSYGTFISAIIEFVIIALAVFVAVRYINSLKREKVEADKKEEPAVRTCPFCKEGIAPEATRCPHCTAKLSKAT